MNYLKEGIVVCNNQIKKNILSSLAIKKEIKKISFISLSSLISKLTIEYPKKAILFLSEKHKINPSIAKEYLESMAFLTELNDEKVKMLLEFKQELIEEGLVVSNELFLNNLKNKNITFLGYPKSKKIEAVIKLVNEYTTNVDIIEDIGFKTNVEGLVCKEFISIEDESRYVFKCIYELINKGVSIRNIKIANFSDEYDFIFRRLSYHFQIPIIFDTEKNVLSSRVCKSLFEYLEKSDDVKTIIDLLTSEYKSSKILNSIIRIFNDYEVIDKIKPSFKDVLKMELKNMPYENTYYDEAIELIDFNTSIISDLDHVFFIGFNQNKVYKIKSDVDFVNDSIKRQLGLDTSVLENVIESNILKRKLFEVKNLYISYKLESIFESYQPSSILQELNISVVRENKNLVNNIYEDKLIICEEYDQVNKYNIKSSIVSNHYYDEIRYNDYDNSFKGIDINTYRNDDVLKLSYSSLKEYYSCEYSFYLKYILRIGEYEKNLAATIGSFCHAILQDSYLPDFDIEESVKKHLTNDMTSKEMFFCTLAIDVLNKLILFNKNYEGNSSLNMIECEKQINIKFNEKFIFTGFIDKILYEKSDKTYIAVIDYKTGKDVISTKNLAEGFNLQLPIYLYLIKKSGVFVNPEIVGFYLQKIAIDNNDEDIEDSFKLMGFSSTEMSLLSKLDPDFSNSKYIAKMKLKADGNFYKNSNVITKKQEEEMYNLVDNLIKDAYGFITEARFRINPKKIDQVNRSCDYCDYKDVCYKKYEDFVNLKSNDFLGGDDNVDE